MEESPCLQAGMIVDDELNRLLVNPLIPGVRLHVVLGEAVFSERISSCKY